MTNQQVGWIVAAILVVGLGIGLLIGVNHKAEAKSESPWIPPVLTSPAPPAPTYDTPAPQSELSCNMAGGVWVKGGSTYPWGACVGYDD
jgi:hypothetical protein